jgi:HPt (histidine-containing phosphotransfer) domain-containing protein
MNLFLFYKTGRIALLVVALPVLLVSAGASWWSINNLVGRDAWVAHTHEVLAELRFLPSVLAKANEDRLAIHEARPRALLRSPQETLTNAHQSLTRLGQLTLDNGRQHQRLIREVLSTKRVLTPTRRTFAPLDTAAILERLGGDTAALREVAALFRQDAARLLGEIDSALARGDVRLVQRSAHGLKGSAGLFGSVELIETAAELEKLEGTGDLKAGRAILERLSPHVEALCSALEPLANN